MISHGNLINSIFQTFVFAEEALKVQEVRISFLSDPLVDLCTPKIASGMEWPRRHEYDIQCSPDTSYLWSPSHRI